LAPLALNEIKGFLCDLDGVLYVGDKPIEGAVAFVEHLQAAKIPCRFLTNTTTRSLDTLFEKVQRLGLPIEKSELVTPPKIAAEHLRRMGQPRCLLIMEDDTKKDLAGIPTDENDPEVIVIGHYANRWNYDLLNRLFHMIMNGTQLVALHKGRYWQTERGLTLDIGAFVTALEYATGTQATVIGKPSQTFFELALADLGLPAEKVAMIGDDINSDIGGAQRAGLRGILVRTGKYRAELVEQSLVTPDLVIDSIALLKTMLHA